MKNYGRLCVAVYYRTEQKRVGSKKKKRRKQSKERRRQATSDSYKSSFTTFDVFGYILDLWINQAIALGAKDSLYFLAKQLWFRYLKELGVAFQHSNTKERISKLPTYRDLQVAITGRKRVIPSSTVQRWSLSKARGPKRVVTAESDLDDHAVRKRRRKERRSFLKTLNREESISAASGSRSSTQAEDSPDSDDEMSSTLPPSTPKTGFFSDDDSFGLSLSFNTSMHNESSSMGQVFETDSNQASSGITGTDSDTCSEFGGSKNFEDKNFDVHLNVLENIDFKQVLKEKSKANHEGSCERSPDLLIVFSLFCLAVMLNEDNWITLSDLTFWADCGSISYKACILGVPQDMKLSGVQDYKMFAPKIDTTDQRYRIEYNISQLGAMMKLEKVILSPSVQTSILCCIGRYVRELSLPVTLIQTIENKLGKLVLKEFQFRFPTTEELSATKEKLHIQRKMPSLDVYCLAIILFVLKYDFGLDDRTEVKLSTVAQQENEKLKKDSNSKDRYFVFSEWLHLTKRRVYLVAKYCYHLQKRFTKSLVPEVEPTVPCMVRSIEEISTHAEIIRSHTRGMNNKSDRTSTSDSHNVSDSSMSEGSSEYSIVDGWENEEQRDISRVSNFLRKEFNSNRYNFHTMDDESKVTSSVRKNTLDLSTSDIPLHDFSLKHIEYNTISLNEFEVEDKVRNDDAEKLKSLIDSYNHKIFCPADHTSEPNKQKKTKVDGRRKVKKKTITFENTFEVEENYKHDFMIAPLHVPQINQTYINRHISSDGYSNPKKVLLTSMSNRLPNLNEISSQDTKDLFSNRKYWMTHFPGSLHFDCSDTADIYGPPASMQRTICW